jgi:hypothetical protein
LFAYRTLRSLPRKGKTPKKSLPITSNPAIAKLLAESPYVKINVHFYEFRLPASLASSNFVIP